jgi:2-dehydropantoate 2-reductase
MPSIVIIGPGAIGSTVAAQLVAAPENEVLLLGRRDVGPITVKDGTNVTTVPAPLSEPPMGKAVDWIFVATKTYHVEAVAPLLAKLSGPTTRLAVLQNGVEHVERFAPYFPAERILPVVVDCPVERRSATDIRQRGQVFLTVPEGADGQAFAELFAGSSAIVDQTSDFTTAVWSKLCINAAGVVSALTLRPSGVMRDVAIATVAREIVRECIAVGRAEGAQLEAAFADTVVERYQAAPPDSGNSLYVDRLAGVAGEFDARNGVIARLGQKHGIPTPLNSMAVALLAATC